MKSTPAGLPGDKDGILFDTPICITYETRTLLLGAITKRSIISIIREILNSPEGIEETIRILTMCMDPDFILPDINFIDDNHRREIQGIIATLNK